MKQALLPMAAMALLLASCDTSTKDSYQNIKYPEYNLIVDNQSMDVPAQASFSNYDVKFNISKNVIDINGTDIIINNQKYSFETDTMSIRTQTFKTESFGDAFNYTFSKVGTTTTGSAASNLNGKLVWCLMPSGSNLLSPNYSVTVGQRLDLSYTLNDRYSVQTFWPAALYKGLTVSTANATSHTSRSSDYLTQIDFEKKTASVYVYNADFSPNQAPNFPKVIRFEDIPVVFTHDGFSLESASPKTTVLGKKDNVVTMVDSVGFAATDFSLALTSSDLTDVMISYKLDGKSINFRGCSILKVGQ
ncbi:MAG: hypothetical protein K2H38_08370 [Muribaculaceae bacterium]|nr:hypothetical protein [Muribaculaceae bacterium]